MKRILLSLIGVALTAVVASAVSLWTPVADKLQQSTVFIELGSGGKCSGFVIDEKRHYVLTAGHCDDEKILVDGTQTIKMFRDERKDLMVLRAGAIDKPALKLSKTALDVGDEVASFGFGFALEMPMFRIHHVSILGLEIPDLGSSGPFVMFDTAFIAGQSGGPVVNQQGEVVAIVQRGGEGVGIGVDAKIIKDRVGRYFGDDK